MPFPLSCPFCGHTKRYESEDLPWTDNVEFSKECENCDKEFMIIAVVSIDHEAIDPETY